MIPKYFFKSRKLRELLHEPGDPPRENCLVCEGEDSCEINYQYKYKLPGSEEVIAITAWECYICHDVVIGEKSRLAIAEHFKKPYEQVSIQDNVLVKRKIH